MRGNRSHISLINRTQLFAELVYSFNTESKIQNQNHKLSSKVKD